MMKRGADTVDTIDAVGSRKLRKLERLEAELSGQMRREQKARIEAMLKTVSELWGTGQPDRLQVRRMLDTANDSMLDTANDSMKMGAAAALIISEAFGAQSLGELEAVLHELPAEVLRAKLSPVLAKYQDVWQSAFGWSVWENASSEDALGVFRFILRPFGFRLVYKRARRGGKLTYVYSLAVMERTL